MNISRGIEPKRLNMGSFDPEWEAARLGITLSVRPTPVAPQGTNEHAQTMSITVIERPASRNTGLRN